MATQQIAHRREDAEIYHGETLCQQKSRELLNEISLPKGLLPLDGIVEVGYNRTTGFVWLKQKKKKEHRFQAIGRTVSYDTEVTAFVDERRMRRVTGVKSKELFVWVTISEIAIEDPNSGKISFSNPSGISRTFPVSAFDLAEQEEEKNKKVNISSN
ncbi:hypothetical protein L6164_035490 [Bauhinia variegata]|uniref:Uncharacterized protein n=3 Tax=Bauhinia variegata TaxID=167791 RepID=A0ACB9KE35_BAUVA|nr:hypothetical protein L6164_035478 [Bauhinia variegata]KAI4295434.1 hypothetical protein L6164_035481 [Bauhinia variegata]KAI4295443.1 hypothetical protein L6164_035490 [Bauhinia variegata]